MYTRNQRTEGASDTHEQIDDVLNENDESNNEHQPQSNFDLRQYQREGDLSMGNDEEYSESNLLVPVGGDERAAYMATLLREADLSYLIQLDPIHQLEYFLSERLQLIDELEHLRTHYEKEGQALRHRLDEAENENDRLMAQHRSLSKQLILYRNLVDAPENPRSATESKDYQQLKRTIEEVVEENERLHAEVNYFKTSDPLYEQVQLLETANMHMRQQLNQAMSENNQMQQMLNFDEIAYLKACLLKSLDECEQLRLANKRLIQQQISFSKQVHIYPSPPSPLSNQLQLSPISTRSSRSVAENLSVDYSSNDLVELHEHVQRLEQTLQRRDYDLQKLQNQIERGTSSIMSSIEDLCIASSKISSPVPLFKQQPSLNELQNEIDQLHDQLDELTNENQLLRTRLQEVDTIYEENQYLYEEKSRWTEEMEQVRRHQLTLVQEIHALKQRGTDASDVSQLQQQLEQLSCANRDFEDEVLHLREQIHLIGQAYEHDKQDLVNTNEHYKQILQGMQQEQKLSKKLARIERMNMAMATEFEQRREEYEERIRVLQEQNDTTEQKYTSLHDIARKLQDDLRQKELDFAHQMDNIIEQRDTLQSQVVALQQQYGHIPQRNEEEKQETSPKNEPNSNDPLALTVNHRSPQSTMTLSELQEKYDHDVAAYLSQIASLRAIQKQMTESYDSDILKSHQTIIHLQHQNNQCCSQLEHYRSNIDKLQAEINEKQNFIQQVQNDLSERSALYVSINNQLSQENKVKTAKLSELERAFCEEQQSRIELQQRLQDLLKSPPTNKQPSSSHTGLEQHQDPSTRRELFLLRNELTTRSDENIMLQHSIHDEKHRRHAVETKLKRLKQEYVDVRTQLYKRMEENQSLQYELIECRLAADYYAYANTHSLTSGKSSNDPATPNILQLYLKEKSDHLHCQLACRTYQQQIEHLQKSGEQLKQEYRQRLDGERNIHESEKMKYAEYIRSIQRDLQETRQLLAQDAEIKLHRQAVFQQAVDERKPTLLTSTDETDKKDREMHAENALLTSKVHSLEQQMKSLTDRIDRTVWEQSELRRTVNSVQLDINISPDTSTSSASASSVLPSGRTTTTYVNSTDEPVLVRHRESLTFNDRLPNEVAPTS